MKNMFVISCIARRNILGEVLENGEWRYACIDDRGPMATGYPTMGFSMYEAKTFPSIKDAEEWFNSCKKYLFEDRFDYDFDTLAIRKVAFNTKKKLSVKDI